MRGTYGLLCEKYGSYIVSEELRLLGEAQRVDLEISMARMRKLSALFRRLDDEVEGKKEGGGDGRSVRGSLMVKKRTK